MERAWGQFANTSAAILSQSLTGDNYSRYPRSGAVADFADRRLWLWTKRACLQTLWEELKIVRNEHRLKFLSDFAALCQVEGPPLPPPDRASLSSEEMRGLGTKAISALPPWPACVKRVCVRGY